MKKTLSLHRETIRQLTAEALRGARGGASDDTWSPAGMQSYRNEDTKYEPCVVADTDTCAGATTPR